MDAGAGSPADLDHHCVFLALCVALIHGQRSLCAIFYILGNRGPWYADKSIMLAIVAMSVLLVFRHRDNITKLLTGTESRLGSDKKNKPTQ
jgi:glycerol-3-phosphate acyltransferase PlsY